MCISWSAWEQTQYNLVEDFIDLFLPPKYTFSIEANYPKTASVEALIEDRLDSLELPEQKLFHLGKLLEESYLEDFPCKVTDLFTLYAYNILEGFGHGSASNLQGAAFEGLNQLATAWGLYLAREVERLFRKWQLFASFADFTLNLFGMFCQIPPKELGEAIRESITPAYLRAGETVAYELALFDNKQARMRESLSILEASDAELERAIANIFGGYSTTEVGRRMQRMVVRAVSQLTEIFSSTEFKEKFNEVLPTAVLIACKNISWYIGHRLSRNLEYDPRRTIRLLDAIGRRKEVTAAMEHYLYRYNWQGNRDKAIRLGWQAVASKYFHFSSIEENIHEDEWQEKFIGAAQGLEDYTEKYPAIDALKDGFLGKLGAYLMRAAKNEETDYVRKQTTDGNIALTDALHVEDLRHSDREEDEELSDEEILSRAKEKCRSSGDPIAEALERRETLREWWRELTDKERTAATLMARFKNQQKVAEVMGISQPAVSQLLCAAWRKYRKKLKIAG